jgi:hypothetical protein
MEQEPQAQLDQQVAEFLADLQAAREVRMDLEAHLLSDGEQY